MKVRLDRTFAMPGSPEVTWGMLQDIEAVAACMPGAAITERIDAEHYKGTVALKVGPASLKFRGEIEVKELDTATRTLRLVAKGTDTSGSSAASMDLTARVEAAEGGMSNLVGHSEASVSGKVAAFASRMMDAVADQIMKQFAANFAARVGAQQAESSAGAAAAPGDTPSQPPGQGTATAPEAAAAAVSHAASAAVSHAASAAVSHAPPAAVSHSPPAGPQQELNGLSLLLAVLKDWLRGLFSKKSA